MSITYGLTSVRDLLAKLKRDAEILEVEVTSDGFFNFVITGYSMIDWVKNDPSLLPSAKDQASLNSLRIDPFIRVCGDIANASKHFILTTRVPVTSSASSISGFGVGRFGSGGYGVGEESIAVELNDGTKFDCLDLVHSVVLSWENFFETHGI